MNCMGIVPEAATHAGDVAVAVAVDALPMRVGVRVPGLRNTTERRWYPLPDAADPPTTNV